MVDVLESCFKHVPEMFGRVSSFTNLDVFWVLNASHLSLSAAGHLSQLWEGGAKRTLLFLTVILVCATSPSGGQTEVVLLLHLAMLLLGEGNGTPLQYSWLENPMDRGAWWAAVHGVARSRTRLSDFTFTFRFQALEKEMATQSSVLAWRVPGMAEPGGLLSLGLHRVGHD